MAFTVWPGFPTVARTGGLFDRTAEVQERLLQAPGEEARLALAPTHHLPPSESPDPKAVAPLTNAPPEVKVTPAPCRWSLRAVRATFPWLREMSLSGVWRVLQRSDLRLRSTRVQHSSPDPEYGVKQARLLACLTAVAQHPDEAALVFLDEMGYYRWPEAADAWAPGAPAPSSVAERAGANNQQWRVIGALNALTGRVDYRENYIVGRQQVVSFYRQLNQAYGGVKRLYVVQDNWSIHRHPDVVAALASLPRIEPVWLPTYAPWLNPIEKLWRWLRQDQLYVHRLAADWSVLRERVNGFLDQFAGGSHAVLRYVGLLGDGKLAQALQQS
jgi:transposase